jgi:hypothetical protein
MEIRSDVAIAIKNEAFESLSQATQSFIREWFNLEAVHDEGMLFHARNVKWYNTYREVTNLYNELIDINADDFVLIEANHDYPHAGGDTGVWYNNPWSVYKEVRVAIDWCEA